MPWGTDHSALPDPGRYPAPHHATRAVPPAAPLPAGGKGQYGLWRAAVRAVRQIIGAPDYEAYLDHCRQTGHLPRLSEAAYMKEFFEAKVKGVRCC